MAWSGQWRCAAPTLCVRCGFDGDDASSASGYVAAGALALANRHAAMDCVDSRPEEILDSIELRLVSDGRQAAETPICISQIQESTPTHQWQSLNLVNRRATMDCHDDYVDTRSGEVLRLESDNRQAAEQPISTCQTPASTRTKPFGHSVLRQPFGQDKRHAATDCHDDYVDTRSDEVLRLVSNTRQVTETPISVSQTPESTPTHQWQSSNLVNRRATTVCHNDNLSTTTTMPYSKQEPNPNNRDLAEIPSEKFEVLQTNWQSLDIDNQLATTEVKCYQTHDEAMMSVVAPTSHPKQTSVPHKRQVVQTPMSTPQTPTYQEKSLDPRYRASQRQDKIQTPDASGQERILWRKRQQKPLPSDEESSTSSSDSSSCSNTSSTSSFTPSSTTSRSSSSSTNSSSSSTESDLEDSSEE